MSKSGPVCLVPRTKTEAAAAIGAIAEMQREKSSVEVFVEQKIGEIKAVHDPVVFELARRIDALARGVQVYCEAHRGELVEGGKTVSLGTGEVCWRDRPWSVSVGNRSEEEVVDSLLARKLKRFVRVKMSLDKRAILSERGKIADRIEDIVTFERGENFVIKPFGGSKEDVVLPVAASG